MKGSWATTAALALWVGSLGCDPGATQEGEPRSAAVVRVEVDVAPTRPETDERPTRVARIVGPTGVEPLGPVLEVATSPDGRTIAVLDEAHELRVHGEPDRGIATEAVPGVRICDEGRIVFARRLGLDASPSELELVVWDAEAEPVSVAPWGDQLDRVITVSPDCAFAILVVRERGMPVVLAIDLRDGLDRDESVRTIALANRDLPRTPGRRPPGFVPVPHIETPATWLDRRTVRWTVMDETVTLTIPEGEP